MLDNFRTDRLDWEDVRFFVGLARHQSLSATARAFGVNHATVARRILGLEQALGVTLFERRPTGYALTEAGREALEGAAAMADAAEALRRPASDGLAGTVRLTATRSVGEGFLIGRLGELRRRHPALDIELIPAIRSLSLARGEADLALRFGPPPDGELAGRRVATLGFGFYAPPEIAADVAAGRPPTLIGFDEGSAQVPEARWLARHFPSLRVAVRSDSHVSQAIAARAGCGVALLPHFLAVGDPALVAVDLGRRPDPRDLWLLARSGAARTPRLRAVSDFLVDLFRREQSRFLPAEAAAPAVVAVDGGSP